MRVKGRKIRPERPILKIFRRSCMGAPWGSSACHHGMAGSSARCPRQRGAWFCVNYRAEGEEATMPQQISRRVLEPAQEAIRKGAIELSGSARDYNALLERIGDAHYVLLGEASHGTHEFYRERA